MAVEVDVVPVGAYRLPGAGRDGTLLRREGALVRLLHPDGEPAVVRAWAAGNRVRFRAEAARRDTALAAIDRMRFALGTDHDLRDFHRAFKRDPLIGPVIRSAAVAAAAAAARAVRGARLGDLPSS